MRTPEDITRLSRPNLSPSSRFSKVEGHPSVRILQSGMDGFLAKMDWLHRTLTRKLNGLHGEVQAASDALRQQIQDAQVDLTKQVRRELLKHTLIQVVWIIGLALLVALTRIAAR